MWSIPDVPAPRTSTWESSTPDGGIAFLTAEGGAALGRAGDLGSFRAVAAGVQLTPAFAVTARDVLSHRFAGGEPRGHYALFLLVVEAGALADGVLADGEVLGLAAAPFPSRDAAPPACLATTRLGGPGPSPACHADARRGLPGSCAACGSAGR